MRANQQRSRLPSKRQGKRSSWALTHRGWRRGRLAERAPAVLTHAGDDRRQQVQDGIYLRQCIASAETKPDCALKPLVSKAHGDEHV
jgi:hypothetical protein